MGKTATIPNDAAVAAAEAARPVPYISVDTAGPETFVQCAGLGWAGRSEVPADTLTDAQLAALKADKRLTVDAFERPHVETT